MTVFMPEDGFSESAELLAENTYGRAYIEFMEGLVLRDADTLRHAGNIIEGSGFPLAECVEDGAYLLENALYEDNPEQLADQIDECFTNTVRSYVYSGLELDIKNIMFCAQLLGYNNDELREIIYPSTDFFAYLDRSGASLEERRDLRYYGRSALLRLGLGTTAMKLAHRLGFGA